MLYVVNLLHLELLPSKLIVLQISSLQLQSHTDVALVWAVIR